MTRWRTETIGDATLHLGDCREVLPTLPHVAAVVTDPPYGMGWNTNSHRFSGGQVTNRMRRMEGRGDWGAITADDQPFDPAPWLDAKEVILWGSNHYAQRLPSGTTLVWVKRLDDAFGSFLSDAEIAWQKGGQGVYCFRDLTNYALTRDRAHPTQKPVGLMEWCIGRTKAETVVDPYMGSGTTGVACTRLARRFVGVEIEERYFDAACRRVEETWKQPRLFEEPNPPPKQEELAL